MAEGKDSRARAWPADIVDEFWGAALSFPVATGHVRQSVEAAPLHVEQPSWHTAQLEALLA